MPVSNRFPLKEIEKEALNLGSVEEALGYLRQRLENDQRSAAKSLLAKFEKRASKESNELKRIEQFLSRERLDEHFVGSTLEEGGYVCRQRIPCDADYDPRILEAVAKNRNGLGTIHRDLISWKINNAITFNVLDNSSP